MTLSDEQQKFMTEALSGKNVLVDACIGSGKTTAIQQLCNTFSSDKKILYLTYNRLLKFDAQKKLTNPNVTVQNYHGFASQTLHSIGVEAGVGELIQAFLKCEPPLPSYDVLILDEYQDITQEISDELLYIKRQLPDIQIIAVGDLCQKIYDFTTLTNINKFIHELLDNPTEIKFTKCFRLPRAYAEKLGRVWGKTINGVNTDCTVEKMKFDDAVRFLGTCNPEDVLCLGAKTNGTRVSLQNEVERKYPSVYNKDTLWSAIKDDGSLNSTKPKDNSAIFTTFDGSKGMERPFCLICDYDTGYWNARSRVPQQKYDVLRNIFLVAASRGKNRIIFVEKQGLSENGSILTEKELSVRFETNHNYLKPVNVSEAFDFKYREDVEACYDLLHIEKVQDKDSEIEAKMSEGLIDLSPCIGEYVEASFFKNYDIDSRMAFLKQFSDRKVALYKGNLQKEILALAWQETGQRRYVSQVQCPYVSRETTDEIRHRLRSKFTGYEEEQVQGSISFACRKDGKETLILKGCCDVLKDDIVYELKFVSELQHTHFLQLACYLVMLEKEAGYLWNIRNNEMYKVSVPDTTAFMNQVARTITKRDYKEYYIPVCRKYLAVIDVETNQSYGTLYGGSIRDGAVMSVGVAIADAGTYKCVDRFYGIVTDEAEKPSWEPARRSLYLPEAGTDVEGNRQQVLAGVKALLKEYDVDTIAAYNARFDKDHLPELQKDYTWIDIMLPCEYRQYNPYLPLYLQTYSTGKVANGYKVDDLLRYIGDPHHRSEKHNALTDALDELFIMKKLNHPLDFYQKVQNMSAAALRKDAGTVIAKAANERIMKAAEMKSKLTDKTLNLMTEFFELHRTDHNIRYATLYGWTENVHPCVDPSSSGECLEFTLYTKSGVHAARFAGAEIPDLREYQIVVIDGKYERSEDKIQVYSICGQEEYEAYENMLSGMQNMIFSIDTQQECTLDGQIMTVSADSPRFALCSNGSYIPCILHPSCWAKEEDRTVLRSGNQVCITGTVMSYKGVPFLVAFTVTEESEAVATEHSGETHPAKGKYDSPDTLCRKQKEESTVSDGPSQASYADKVHDKAHDMHTQLTIEGMITDVRLCSREVIVMAPDGKRITCRYDPAMPAQDKSDIRKGVYLAFCGYYSGKKFCIRYTKMPETINADVPLELGHHALTIRELDRYLYEYGMTKEQICDIMQAVQISGLSLWISRADKYVKQYHLPFLKNRC